MTCSKARTLCTFFSNLQTLQAFSLSIFQKNQQSKRFWYLFFKMFNSPTVFGTFSNHLKGVGAFPIKKQSFSKKHHQNG